MAELTSPEQGKTGAGLDPIWTRTPFFALEGDIDTTGELVATVGPDLAGLFVYTGDQYLFTDNSLAAYDADTTSLAVQRSLALLDRVG